MNAKYYVALVLFVIGGTAVAACGDGEIVARAPGCWTPASGFDNCCCVNNVCDFCDAGTDAGPDEGTDASTEEDASPKCEGTCVPLRPTDYAFSFPHMVWFGSEHEAPTCPGNLVHQFTRYRDLIVPPASCPSCTCAPSTGSCAPPSTFIAHAAACAGDGAAETPFAPPDGWDGSCSAENAVPASLDCGGVPCVQSLTVDPLVKTDVGCEPSPPSTLPLPEPRWGEVAIACEGLEDTGLSACADDEMCVPLADQGFRYCVHFEGNVNCPVGGYSERHVYFRTFTNTRTCAECTCGAVEGSSCTGTVTAYKDDACGAFLLGTSISSVKGACIDMDPAGQPLGSKRVADLTYTTGTCVASGGELEGVAEPSGPYTFCCAP